MKEHYGRGSQEHIGKTFGVYTVAAYLGSRSKERIWCAVCQCGQVRRLSTHQLFGPKTLTCTHRKQDAETIRKPRSRKPEMPERKVWRAMIFRCHNPKSNGYKHYGARGIKVCTEWRKSFAAFLNDVGRRPSPEHSIDRIDNSGDYEPSNCRWATLTQQARNTRATVFLTYRNT